MTLGDTAIRESASSFNSQSVLSTVSSTSETHLKIERSSPLHDAALLLGSLWRINPCPLALTDILYKEEAVEESYTNKSPEEDVPGVWQAALEDAALRQAMNSLKSSQYHSPVSQTFILRFA